jgi:hypothetical protein
VERLNSEGIPRHELKLALGTRRLVAHARRIDTCLLCRRHGVNEAGLCEVCYSMIVDAEELELVQSWLRGEGP